MDFAGVLTRNTQIASEDARPRGRSAVTAERTDYSRLDWSGAPCADRRELATTRREPDNAQLKCAFGAKDFRRNALHQRDPNTLSNPSDVEPEEEPVKPIASRYAPP